MSEFFTRSNFHKRRNRRRDIVKPDVVNEFREKFGLKKYEMAELMGISGNQYNNCEKKGGFLSFRFYAAVDAIELSAIKKSLDIVKQLAEVKSGINLDDKLNN